MQTSLNLKDLEKNSWTSVYQSGLVDITIGLIFIVSSVCHIFDDLAYYLMPLYLVPTLFLILTIKFVAEPRMGLVKVNKRRRRKNATFFFIATSILVFLLILTIFSKTNLMPEGISTRILLSSIILLIVFANAFFLSFTRLYLYGLVIVAAFNLNEHIRENPGLLRDGGYAYLLAAIILLTTGVIYLVKFLKNYPLNTEGEYNA
jgi:hypothetical protein